MIASLHAEMPCDWAQIAALYGELAADAYRCARELTGDGAERRFLERRLTELAATAGSG